MSAGKLSALLSLSSAGTPGKWEIRCGTIVGSVDSPRRPICGCSDTRMPGGANAALIASAVNFVRQDLPVLVALLEIAPEVHRLYGEALNRLGGFGTAGTDNAAETWRALGKALSALEVTP